MKTSVEWLEKEIKKFNTVITTDYLLMLIEQAKEMEKQQIIDACNYADFQEIGEYYYKETFNK